MVPLEIGSSEVVSEPPEVSIRNWAVRPLLPALIEAA